MPSIYDEKSGKNVPETIDIVPESEVIQFHEPSNVQNRMIHNNNNNKHAPDGGAASFLTKYAMLGSITGLILLILLSVTFIFVRTYRSDKRKSKSPSKSDKKSDKKRREKKQKSMKERKKRKSSKTDGHHKKKRKSKSSTLSSSSSSLSSGSSSSDEPSTTVNSSGDSSIEPKTSDHKTKRKKTKKKKTKERTKDENKTKETAKKGIDEVKMVPLTERHPTKVSLRAINRQLNARNFFEDKLKTLRDGSERERMLKALREMQVTTRWPDLKTEDISSDSLEDTLPKHERTALSPFINFQRPRLMANPASNIATKHSSHGGHSSVQKVSYYRYKETELAWKGVAEEQKNNGEPVVFKPARLHSQITPKRLEDFFSLEKLNKWDNERASNDSSDSSSDSLKLSGAIGRASEDESFVIYSRDANPRRIRDHSVLHARPTPPETIDDTNSPPTPTHVRKTLATRAQSRTVRFDRFTKRYFV